MERPAKATSKPSSSGHWSTLAALSMNVDCWHRPSRSVLGLNRPWTKGEMPPSRDHPTQARRHKRNRPSPTSVYRPPTNRAPAGGDCRSLARCKGVGCRRRFRTASAWPDTRLSQRRKTWSRNGSMRAMTSSCLTSAPLSVGCRYSRSHDPTLHLRSSSQPRQVGNCWW